jgi:hypothetical protein
MAKTGRKTSKKARPLLAAAFFCERILQEKDGVHSAIRIVDALILPPPNVPAGSVGEPVVPAIAFIAIKSGDAKGEHTLRLDLTYPSGKRLKTQEIKIALLGDENGVSISAQILVPIKEAGLYWYDVLIDEELFTRMPVRIIHEKTTGSGDETESEETVDR